MEGIEQMRDDFARTLCRQACDGVLPVRETDADLFHDPARAIASFARQNQITQIVIGSSQRSRWQQLTGGGSRVKRVIDEAGALSIDVHVIALRKTSPAGPPGPGSTERPGLVRVMTSEESESPPAATGP